MNSNANQSNSANPNKKVPVQNPANAHHRLEKSQNVQASSKVPPAHSFNVGLQSSHEAQVRFNLNTGGNVATGNANSNNQSHPRSQLTMVRKDNQERFNQNPSLVSSAAALEETKDSKKALVFRRAADQLQSAQASQQAPQVLNRNSRNTQHHQLSARVLQSNNERASDPA